MKMAESSQKKKRVENAVGKGEIARYEQLLLFPVFSKRLVLQTHKNKGLFSKRVHEFTKSNELLISLTIVTNFFAFFFNFLIVNGLFYDMVRSIVW